MGYVPAALAKRLLFSVPLWVILFSASQGVARADTFFIISTRGEIGPNQIDRYLGLHVSPLQQGASVPPGGSVVLGSLAGVQLDTTPANYNGVPFALHMLISNNFDESVLHLTTHLVGAVTEQGEGGVLIDFNNAPIVFSFQVGGGSGEPVFRTFALTIDDLFVGAGGRGPITGRITDVTAPEPATLLLLGTGLAAVGAAIRNSRRREG